MSFFSFTDSKERVFFWVATLYIIYMVFPILSQLTGLGEEVPALIVVALFTILYPKALANKTFYFTILYLLILLFYTLIGKPITIGVGSAEDARKLMIEAAWILPSVIIFSVLTYLDNIKLYKSIAFTSIAMLILSFVYLIPLIQANSNFLRQDSEALIEGSGILGMPSYSLMHAYVFLIPALCYGSKYFTKMYRWIWLLFLAIFFYMIVHTYVTTSLFVSVVMILSALLYREGSKNGIFTFVAIAIIAYVLYLFNIWSILIDLILPLFGETAVESKLIDIQQSLTVGTIQGGTLEGRMGYHQISWNAFWSNPLFGSTPVGGHSGLIDRLGGLGLFGFFPFFMIFISFIKTVRGNYITYSSQFFLFCSILTIALFLYNKGLFGSQGWLFSLVIFPSLLLSIQEKECNFTQDIEIP